ncbi:MAG: vitamin B12 dependent-methionine synthase activation domain-containing protein, partial [Prevotella sp.]|nr:vitamin B12 dependent-methionine synthase activation domain-containing protein [Prevotella sp.]
MKLEYNISDIVPYINWIYFFHAWNLTGKPQAEKDKLQ